MTRRTIVLGAALLALGLPAVLVLTNAAVHYFANRTTGTIVSAGVERDYIVHVPRTYDRSKPGALVISLHGGVNWPAAHMNISQWNRVADEHGFIVAYPAGEGGGPRVWSMRGARNPSRMPDVVFISELIDKLAADYNIDPARVYVNGLSQGAGMSFVLSCALAHRIAAVGLVGAAHFMAFEWCGDAAPVPMISFHGTADQLTRYHGGKVWLATQTFPDIPEWTSKWARRNRCAPAAAEVSVAADVTRLEYAGCAGNASVVLYTIHGGGHTWPGGTQLPEWLLGPTTRSIDASEVMWEFFRAHPMAPTRIIGKTSWATAGRRPPAVAER